MAIEPQVFSTKYLTYKGTWVKLEEVQLVEEDGYSVSGSKRFWRGTYGGGAKVYGVTEAGVLATLIDLIA